MPQYQRSWCRSVFQEQALRIHLILEYTGMEQSQESGNLVDQNRPERVFLTGANGLLGSHICRELVKRNYKVTAFIEKGREGITLSGLTGLAMIFGDILNRHQVLEASAGCDYIIHAAASTTVIPARSKIVNEVNINGTQNILLAAQQHGLKRLVYVGTATSFGFGTRENPGNETKAYSSGKFGLDYIDSKYEAHRRVLHAVKAHDLPAIIVCPTFMFGRYDSKPGSGAMLVNVYNNKIPGYSFGGKNYVSAGDVSVGVVNALTMGRIGESYILGNQNMDYKAAFQLIAKTLNVKGPVLPLPRLVVMAYGACCSLLNLVLKKPMPVNLALAKIANEGCYYDSSKARNELKLPQTPIEEAIRECYEWLKKENLVI